jgi:hypothetical protein
MKISKFVTANGNRVNLNDNANGLNVNNWNDNANSNIGVAEARNFYPNFKLNVAKI